MNTHIENRLRERRLATLPSHLRGQILDQQAPNIRKLPKWAALAAVWVILAISQGLGQQHDERLSQRYPSGEVRSYPSDMHAFVAYLQP